MTVWGGASGAVIPIAINDDSIAENAETVILTLTAGNGYTLGSETTHTLTISDNDWHVTARSILRLGDIDHDRGRRYAIRGCECSPGGAHGSLDGRGQRQRNGSGFTIQYAGGTAQREGFTIAGVRPITDKVYDAYDL